MDDLVFGTRNARGDWAPKDPPTIAPFYAFPPKPIAVLKWLPGYFLPWNLLFALSAALFWTFVVPPIDVLKTLSFGWMARLFVVNTVAVLLFYEAFEYRLYVQRAQGRRFKYNAKFPAEQPGKIFWFGSQAIEGRVRALLSGVPIWTAYEVLLLWCYANGIGNWINFSNHPFALALFALLAPALHETHFFLIHRFIHVEPLYKWVHSVHHNSVNPSPWSSLAMHPVEHLLYFSVALWSLVIPSHPVIAIYQLHFAGFGAIPGHVGFEKMELGENFGVDSHAYVHYLHHKYFEVNYADGLVPLDKLFGTWHDGSPEAESRRKARMAKRKAAPPEL